MAAVCWARPLARGLPLVLLAAAMPLESALAQALTAEQVLGGLASDPRGAWRRRRRPANAAARLE
jgi:hypothetical protein